MIVVQVSSMCCERGLSQDPHGISSGMVHIRGVVDVSAVLDLFTLRSRVQFITMTTRWPPRLIHGVAKTLGTGTSGVATGSSSGVMNRDLQPTEAQALTGNSKDKKLLLQSLYMCTRCHVIFRSMFYEAARADFNFSSVLWSLQKSRRADGDSRKYNV